MTTSFASQLALARWILTTEMGAAEGWLADSEAALRVFHKLSECLAPLITPVGYEALLKRAVHLSRIEYPFLCGAQAAPNTDSVIDTLCETLATVEPGQAREALVAVLGTLVALLELFIGERLTVRLLHDFWPELAISQLVQLEANH